MSKIEKNYSFLINFIAIIISIVALYFSFQSYNLSKTQYIENRQLILIGQVNQYELDIRVKPVDNSKTFLMGNVFFPSFIFNKDIEIQPNGDFKGMRTIENKIKKFISELYPKEKNFIKMSTMNMPIMIRTYYTSNGNSYIDRSLYFVNMTFMVSNEEYKEPVLTFNGLIFIKRLDKEITFSSNILDKMYDKEYNSCVKPTAELK